MKKPQNFLKAIPLAMAVCSSILVSTAKPASAFGWWKTEYLGRATTADNYRYWRSIGKTGQPVAPKNRNDICRWKYPRSNGTVYGKPVRLRLWWGWRSPTWDTDCYHRYWKRWR